MANDDSQFSDFYREVGDETFAKIVAGFYRRVKTDDILGPMYPQDDWDGAEDRLRMFLEQYWGGPHTYNEVRGHPRLRMRHFPFHVDRAARDRWLQLMHASLDELEPGELSDAHRDAMWKHMVQVADMLINQPG
ncbi:globin [Corynebacterium sp. H78]|uniref:globin n=1 Tax=Corynebacterium sp. H78 TaxID=3133417 RepID=UPI0030AC281A